MLYRWILRKLKLYRIGLTLISGTLIYWDDASKLKHFIKASSTSSNDEFHPKRNKNGRQRYLDMIMRSFTRREKKMFWLILFPGNMKKKCPSFPSHSL
jgi:hypothetical protein